MYKDVLYQVIIQIKHLREEAGLTQTEMAEKLKIGMRSYQRYESGESIPTLNFLFEAATVLNFNVKDLFSPIESLPQIGEVTFYPKELLNEFLEATGPDAKVLFEIIETPAFKRAMKQNKLELLKAEKLFSDSKLKLALSTPKTTLLNRTAQRKLGANNELIATSSFHSSPKNVGILWAALLETQPDYFILKTVINDPKRPKSLEFHNVFIKSKDNYFILRLIKPI